MRFYWLCDVCGSATLTHTLHLPKPSDETRRNIIQLMIHAHTQTACYLPRTQQANKRKTIECMNNAHSHLNSIRCLQFNIHIMRSHRISLTLSNARDTLYLIMPSRIFFFALCADIVVLLLCVSSSLISTFHRNKSISIIAISHSNVLEPILCNIVYYFRTQFTWVYLYPDFFRAPFHMYH